MYGDFITGACNITAPSDGMVFIAKLSAADGSCVWAREVPNARHGKIFFGLPIKAHGNGVYLMLAMNTPMTLNPTLAMNPHLCLDQPESLEADLYITKCACRPALVHAPAEIHQTRAPLPPL